MTFDHPEALLLLYALVPIILLMIVNYKRRFTRIYSLLDSARVVFYDDLAAGADNNAPKLPVKAELCLRYAASNLFFAVFFACVSIALAGPRFGSHFVRELRQGADVTLAFDLSRSMNARDCSPLPAASGPPSPAADTVIRGAASSSRLERSVYTAKALIENLYAASAAVGGGGIRFGAALGKGEAILAVPLTGDTEAVFALLNSLTSLTITSRGTNLEKLIDAAAGSFQDDFPSARYIILFSDGETLSGSVTAAVERLRQKRVKLFTAGAGSVYGAPVPETASPDGKQPLPVTSYPRIDVLTNAAERTGGVFVDASSDDAAQTIAGHIRSNSPLSGSESAWTLREESSGRWPLFVIAGLAAFILSRLCSLTLKKKPLGPA